MLFNSYLFVFAFLPLALVGYFGLNRLKKEAWAECFLIGMSLWFYAYFNISYLPIIIGSVLLNYGCSKLFTRLQSPRAKQAIFALGLIANIGTLFYYKYMGFFTHIINDVFKTGFFEVSLLLPLGISFFTFQQVSYLIDSYRGKVPAYRFREYALFVTFFPQLIAGPIVLHSETVPQFADHTKKQFQWDNFAVGMMEFTRGMAKKVLIADYFSDTVTWGFESIAIDTLGGPRALLVMLCYTLQIYFDFSGYCDMATGIGKMFNIDIPMNFNSPYKACSVTDFWKRWHITLTRFLRTYVYFPLGGNRKGTARTYLNLFLVFFISGLWHGANYTFLAWGMMHGIFMVLERIYTAKGGKINPIIGWCYTFLFVNVAWVFFRAESVSQAVAFMGQIVSPAGYLALFATLQAVLPSGIVALAMSLGSMGTVELSTLTLYMAGLATLCAMFLKNTNEKIEQFRPTFCNALLSGVLLYVSIICFSGVSAFLYFNF
ncbi:MAG: MBOAT family O-acyltransferase [Faecalibacterium sp.]